MTIPAKFTLAIFTRTGVETIEFDAEGAAVEHAVREEATEDGYVAAELRGPDGEVMLDYGALHARMAAMGEG